MIMIGLVVKLNHTLLSIFSVATAVINDCHMKQYSVYTFFFHLNAELLGLSLLRLIFNPPQVIG